ncbi:MAG: GTPase HflX [Bacteroidetes bacterium]|nr:GTPase HflX [Bacteroidota bacterium]
MPTLEKAVLVGLIKPGETESLCNEYLDELAFLSLTAGAETQKRFTQKLPKPHPKYFVGSGRLTEIVEYATENETDMVIFDDELSPSQIKNIEKEFPNDIKILDRTNLILDIFAYRAQTAQAKAQVELAQLEYTLPRLTRMWTHLSRQKGGIGMRGPGESEIETDRRIIRNNISLLKKKLAKIDQQEITRRKQRGEKVRVALVGYTNVGKSTIMNLLSDSEILAENKLFATLDTTVRKIVIDRVPFLLSDTVGFIRKLPHNLVESFKSTLDEVREADILLHVIDISHNMFDHHLEVVTKTLNELGAQDKPILLVCNKLDLFREKLELFSDVSFEDNLQELNERFKNEQVQEVVFISAAQRKNMNEFRTKLVAMVKRAYEEVYPHLPNPYDYH